MRCGFRIGAATCAAAVAMVGVLVSTAPAYAAPAKGELRVDQVGYGTTEVKKAYLMSAVAVPGGTAFSVIDSSNAVVYAGTVNSTSRGSWNAATYPYVYDMDFSTFQAPGTYRIMVATDVVAGTSLPFSIQSANDIFQSLLTNVVTFFQSQRDGANVIAGALDRKPAHLVDLDATVYDGKSSDYYKVGDGNYKLLKALAPAAGAPHVDVEGGWFDAGDYLKFVETTSYVVPMMQVAQRNLGTPNAALQAEIDHGLTWLDKMWDGNTKTLYVQVGIGDGASGLNITGDHDVWRLPEADDAMTIARTATPGTKATAQYYVKWRPVFRAAAPGQPISPNLAGRMAATFALAAQAQAKTNPIKARAWLTKAADILALANTSIAASPAAGTLTTAFPYDYYPESQWQDDMALGASELAVAGRMLADPRADGWLVSATDWANRNLGKGGGLNLYDVSALANAELVRGLRIPAAPVAGLKVTEAQLMNDLSTKSIGTAVTTSNNDPFRAGAAYNNYDVVSKSFGLVGSSLLYNKLTGTRTYADFATVLRNWVFGANAWGATFVSGVGSVYPVCMASQLPNIKGKGQNVGGVPGGMAQLGAPVNGPNGTSVFSGFKVGLGDPSSPCPGDKVDRYSAFTSTDRKTRYVDDSESWMTNEAAIDFASSMVLAVALSAAQDQTPGAGEGYTPIVADVAAGGLTLKVLDQQVTIPPSTLNGKDQIIPGALNAVTVLDARGKSQGWSLVGQVSDFVGTSGLILADNLGWSPAVQIVTQKGSNLIPAPGGYTQATAGEVAVPGAGTGLGSPRTLCKGTQGASAGAAECSAGLALGIPATTKVGTYTGVLTLTLI